MIDRAFHGDANADERGRIAYDRPLIHDADEPQPPPEADLVISPLLLRSARR